MSHTCVLKTIALLFTLLLSFSLCKAQIYVKQNATGENDGSSWVDAFADIQDAIDSAKEGDQIWVASGTYHPGQSGDPKSSTFHVTKGIQIYGGFAGTETNRSDRNPTEYPTILSGDLNQDDIADDFETNRSDNVWTVMLVENASGTVPVIDGFTFKGGHADGNYELYEESCGGALLLYGPAMVSNCSFSQNYSIHRAGALFLVDSLEIENKGLDKNQSGFEVVDCQFNNNYSREGGAVNIRLVRGKVPSVVFRNSHFSKNTCEKYGGGLCVVADSDDVSVKVDSCNFSNNLSATHSGAISFQFHEGKGMALSVQNSTFSENSSKDKGGAISVRSAGSEPGIDNRFEINNCQFKGNLSNVGGAIYHAIYASNIKANITKCDFSENQGSRIGGAIYSRTFQKNVNNHFEIKDCSFKKNFTSDITGTPIGGGAIYLYAPGISNFATVNRSEFIENSTNGWGGAIAMVTGNDGEGNRIEIDSCRFENHRSDCGGAIMYMSKASKDTLLISRSQFIGNTIEDTYPVFATKGGALHIDYVFEGGKSYSMIKDCLFENNSNNGGDGGAVYVTPSRQGSFSGFYNSTFKGNRASGKGGAFVYAGIDKAYELEGCTFENNHATNGEAHIFEVPPFDESLFYIFFHGVLWVQVLYSFLLFLISRERTTLYYTLLMIGISLFFLAIIDFPKVYFFNSMPLQTRILLVHISTAIGIIGLVKFAQHYLNVNQIIPFFKKAVFYFFIAYFVLFLIRISLISLGLEEHKAITVILQLFTFLSVSTPIFWALFVLKKGYKPAKYFLLAMLFVGLAIIWLLVSLIQIGHFLDLPTITIQSLILMTVITLGLADGYRVNLLKKDKVRAERLTELDIAKTRLYNNITHEFRTPLTVIMGTSEMLRGNEQEKKLIQHNSKQLLQLINQMLDLSKLEGGALKLEHQQGDILPFIEYLIESFQSLADSKYIKLTFYRELEELIMDYDAEKVQAVITNLLSNAIKFTPESGKVIAHVKKDTLKGKPHLTLIIRDNGPGISAADLPHVFDRFFQVDASDMRRSEGSGIGLALVKELVQLMKGNVDVSSKLGEGTVFTIRIPITNDAPFQADFAPGVGLQSDFENPIEEDSHLFQPLADDVPMVLIIEDNKDVVRFLRSCLQKKYKIEVAYNGQQGIDKALDIVPDIIISDVMMPEADGYTVCKTLKADERTSHIPIIMLTAKATQDDKVLGLDAGADAYLHKPFHRKELEVRLQKLIEGRQQLQQHYQSLLRTPPGSVKSVDPFIQKLRSIIEENISSVSFGISELCQAVNLSRMQVHRKLTAMTGMPTTQFIHSIRLQKAYQLLQETDLNVSEVAYQLGFSDPSYFTRLFVKNYGKTPSEISKER